MGSAVSFLKSATGAKISRANKMAIKKLDNARRIKDATSTIIVIGKFELDSTTKKNLKKIPGGKKLGKKILEKIWG